MWLEIILLENSHTQRLYLEALERPLFYRKKIQGTFLGPFIFFFLIRREF